MMKIIQLIYSLSSGGAEHFVVDLSNQMAAMGHEVTICILLDGKNDKLIFNKQLLKSNVKFHSLNFDRGFSLRKLLLVERFIKARRPDIVYCHLNVIPYVYRMAFCNDNIEFVHTLHSIAPKATGLKIQFYLNRYFYKNNIIQPITISKECNQSYIDYYRLNNAVCIDNGCAAITPSDKLMDVKAEIESYKTSIDTTVFIHVARCHPAKKQQLLIDAFNKLDNEGVNFILLVIGNGFYEKSNRIFVESACNRIHFLGEKNNVGDYLLCADAFCLSSIYEGLPISLIEAMSCGVTPICTPVGGIPDVVKDGVTGFLSRDITVETYVDAIYRFLNNPIRSEVIVDEFEKRFSIQECANKYLSLYEKN